MRNSVRKNFAYQLIYRILVILTPLITSPIVARALGAEKQGTYAATYAFVNYFTLIALLGVENYGSRSIAADQGDKERIQELFWNIYSVQIIASIIALIAYSVSIIFSNNGRIIISLIQGLWIVSALFNINWFFQGIEEFRLTVIRSIIVKIIAVLAVVLFIRKPSDLPLYTFIMAGDAALSSLLVWPFVWKYIGFTKPKAQLIKCHVKPMFVLFIPVLAITLFHIMDKTMLDIFSTEANIGYYTNADKLINIPYGIFTALGAVMLPRVTNAYSKGEMGTVKKLLKSSTEVSLFLTGAVGLGIASVAKEFIPFFLGPGYEACITLVYWFVPVMFVKAISVMIRTQYMIPAHEDKLYTEALVVGACVNLVANYLLIRKLGALGAVIGTLISEMAVLVFEMIGTRNEIDFCHMITCNLFYIPAAVVMMIVVRLSAEIFNYVPILIRLAFMVFSGGITYLMVCLIYWTINRKSLFAPYIINIASKVKKNSKRS